MMVPATCAIRGRPLALFSLLLLVGCSDEHKIAEPAEILMTPVTGPTSVVADVLESWPPPSQIVRMEPPAFTHYGTYLAYNNLEVAPGVFRQVEFTFRGSSAAAIHTLHKFRVYIEHARTEPIVLYQPPLTLVDGLGAGMLMSEVSALLGEPHESSENPLDAHWAYQLGWMRCQLDMVPDVENNWRVFNLEFVFE